MLDRVADADDDQHQVVLDVEPVARTGADHRRIIRPVPSNVRPVRKGMRRLFAYQPGIFPCRIDDRPFRIGQIGRLLRPAIAVDLLVERCGDRLLLVSQRNWRERTANRCAARHVAVGKPEQRDEDDRRDDQCDRADEPAQELPHRTLRLSPDCVVACSPARTRSALRCRRSPGAARWRKSAPETRRRRTTGSRR